MIAALVRSIFEQPDRDATWDLLDEVVDRFTQAGLNDIAVYLLDAADDILALPASRPSTGRSSDRTTQ